MEDKKIPITVCDICKAEFHINKDCLQERKLILDKDGLKHQVVLTYLRCPSCGKQYPVIMDDGSTLLILNNVRSLLARRVKFLSHGKKVPPKLEDKYNSERKKLDFKRRQLAEKFDGALYQFEGDIIQLDYRYHAR